MNKNIKITGISQLSASQTQSLLLLYAPLVQNDAIILYQTLLSLKEQALINYNFLTALLAMSLPQIERLRQNLEQYHLIKTYEDDAGTHHIVLQKPLEGDDFITHRLYSRVLFSKMNEDLYKKIKAMFEVEHHLEKYRNISAVIDLGNEIEIIDANESAFEEVHAFGIEHQFDYPSFIKLAQPLMIPTHFLDNPQILHKIGEYAYIYNIDAQNMAKYVAKSTNLATQNLNFEKLLRYISNAKIKVNDNGVTLHPLQFIKKLQQGIEPIKNDRQLVEKLITQYRLNYELINLLIEHSYQKNNTITHNYIEKIAASWIVKGINTIEEAKKTLEVKRSKTVRKDRMMASWENTNEKENVVIEIDELLK